MKKIFLGVFLALASVVLVQVGCDPKATPASATVPAAVNFPSTTGTVLRTPPSPYGIVLDPAGNLFVVSRWNGNVLKYMPGFGAPVTLASGLNYPAAIVRDTAGNLYVGDENGKIFKITPSGVQSIFASGFNYPRGLAMDGAGNIYVADDYSYGIYKVTTAGVVTNIANPHGNSSQTDGPVASAGFYYPQGIAVTKDGSTVYVGDYWYRVSKINGGQVTTLTSSLGYPQYLTWDTTGNLIVSDNTNGLVQLNVTTNVITPLSTFTTNPRGVVVVDKNTLIVANSNGRYNAANQPIYKITLSSFVK